MWRAGQWGWTWGSLGVLSAPGMSKDAEYPWDAEGCLNTTGTHKNAECCAHVQDSHPAPTLDSHDSLFSHDPGGDVLGESLSSLHSGWWLPGLWAP